VITSGIRSLVIFVVFSIGTLVLGLITSWVDRKVTARVQARKGPPWFQPIADVLKLLGKETLVPEGGGRVIFLYSPLVGLASMACAASLLGYVLVRPDIGFLGDVVVLIYLLMVPAVSLILGASASGNPIAIVGASREMKQMLAYELPYLIVVATVLYRSGLDLRLGSVIQAQVAGGWHLWSVSGILAFLVLILSTQAKLGLVPFDIPEADQELMGGIITEYSGPPLAMIKLQKTMMLAVMPLFIVALLMGGISLKGFGILWGLIKYLVIIVLIVLIRNTNPRVRIDQAVRFFWGPVTFVALVGLILAALGL